MQDNKRVWVWVGVVVVLFAIVAFLVWPPNNNANQTATGPTPVYAAKGQVIAGFPQEILLHAPGAITNSYSIAYASSTNLYTVQLNSSSSMQFVYNLYLQYFLSKSWTITNNVTNQVASRGLYVTTSTADASVSIVQQGTGSQVTISYSTK